MERLELPPPPDVSKSLRFFHSNAMFCDVRLWPSSIDAAAASAAESPKYLLVHRVILAASSSYFANTFKNIEEKQDIFLPCSIDGKVLSFLLSWMYGHPLEIQRSSDAHNISFLQNLLDASQCLGIVNLEAYLEGVLNQFGETKPKELEDQKCISIVDDDLQFAATSDCECDSGAIGCDAENSIVETETEICNEDSHTQPQICNEDSHTQPQICNEDSHTQPQSQIENVKVGKNKLEKVFQDSTQFLVHVEKECEKTEIPAKRQKYKKGLDYDHKHAPVVCEKCGKVVKREALEIHNKYFHSNYPPDLLKKYLARNTVDPVLAKHIVDDTFQCLVCEFSLSKVTNEQTFFSNCAKHLYKAHKISSKFFHHPCPVDGCNSVFFSRFALNAHSRKHKSKVPIELLKVACEKCNAVLSKTSLKTHNLIKHTQQGKHPCEICHKVFPNAKYLSAHKKICRRKKRSEFKCAHCNFWGVNKKTFAHHCFRRHGILIEEFKIFACQSCDYKSPLKKIVTMHERTVHVRSFEFKCEVCEKRFATKRLRKTHVERVHQDSQVRACVKCGLVFRSHGGMEYHLLKVHHIGKNGTKADDDEVRIKKPFKCVYCSHVYSLPGNVKKHYKNKHPDRPVRYVDLRKELKASKNRAGEFNDNVLTQMEPVD